MWTTDWTHVSSNKGKMKCIFNSARHFACDILSAFTTEFQIDAGLMAIIIFSEWGESFLSNANTTETLWTLCFDWVFSSTFHVSNVTTCRCERIKAKNPTVHNVFEYFLLDDWHPHWSTTEPAHHCYHCCVSNNESRGSQSERDSNASSDRPTLWSYELRSGHNFGHGIKVFAKANILYNSTQQRNCVPIWCALYAVAVDVSLITNAFTPC